MIKRFFLFSSLAYCLASCDPGLKEANIKDIAIETHFHRFDSAFFTLDTLDFLKNLNFLKSEYSPFFSSGGTLDFWKYQRNDPLQISLSNQVEIAFSPFRSYNDQLNQAMKHFYYYFPDQKPIQFYSYISNLDFNLPILFADSSNFCFAGTDLYLGAKSKYYNSIPSYLAFHRQPKFLIRDCLEAIVQTKLKSANESLPLLNQMIYHGKILYSLQRFQPDLEEMLIIKYASEKMDFCHKNEKSIWAYFVENELLFSTKSDNYRKFIQVAPFSKFGMKFDSQSPGRIGQWIGLQIVKSYMLKNKNITLQELLKERDARKILKLSGYKP